MPRQLNVLVYSGTGTTTESVRHCLYSLRRLLSPSFAVTPVTAATLLHEPWASSCALLVFPGGADLGYCKEFNGEGNRRITQYVRRGGSYLGFCAGGYYGSQMCEFAVGNPQLEVVGRRELAFFPGSCRGPAFSGFKYASEAGAKAAGLVVKAVEVKSTDEGFEFCSYFNGGGVFVDAEKMGEKGVEVLANYNDALDVDDAGTAAVVCCKVGEGKAILTGPHPEFAAVNLNPKSEIPDYSKLVESIAHDEAKRTQFLRHCLEKLGLTLPETTVAAPPLSKIHVTSEDPQDTETLLIRLQSLKNIHDHELKDETDTFHLSRVIPSTSFSTTELASALPHTEDTEDKILDYSTIPKELLFHTTALPPGKETHHFSHPLFYKSLSTYRDNSRCSPSSFGSTMLYAEVITSTNTILDKNPSLLRSLPSGTTATATLQVAGRGRGNNVWISPMGCLIFSTYIRHAQEVTIKAPVIFVQYLVGIAVVEAVKSYSNGYEDVPIRLKWPNDIYVLDPSKDTEEHSASPSDYVKLGGILVNSSYTERQFHLVVGVGVNVSNAAPTTSLNALLPRLNASRKARSLAQLPEFQSEKLLARILVVFDELYHRFCASGWESVEQMYLRRWLHSGQIVRLEMEGNARCRVEGITRDWGLLRVKEIGEEGGGYWSGGLGGGKKGREFVVQSDGNSFDFWRGLVKRKA